MSIRYGSRTALMGLALIALVFVAGVVAGVAGDRYFHRGLTLRTRIVNDMSGVLDQLGLTLAQRRQAETILGRAGPQSREVMLDVAARLRGISDSVDAELRTILTPAQRLKLDSLRRPTTFLLRRKDPSGATRVDTVFPVPKR